jgi:hypothetical protein
MKKYNYKPVLSTMFYFDEDGIGYWDKSMRKADFYVRFDQFDSSYLSGGDPKPNSKLVNYFMAISLNEPSRVYHLAGLVQSQHPEINWNWEEQLFQLEEKIRAKKFSPEYYQETNLNHQSYFYNETQHYNWEFGLYLYLKKCEPEQLLENRVKENMAKWFKG